MNMENPLSCETTPALALSGFGKWGLMVSPPTLVTTTWWFLWMVRKDEESKKKECTALLHFLHSIRAPKRLEGMEILAICCKESIGNHRALTSLCQEHSTMQFCTTSWAKGE